MTTLTYEQYLALYKACNGRTTHFVPVVGTKEWYKTKLSHQEFEQKLARLHEIESHDDEWLFATHPTSYIDVAESEAWESLDLRSDLFVIELEKQQKLTDALARDD